MAGPGQHAGALEVTTGSVKFVHEDLNVVSINEDHYTQFCSVVVEPIDGENKIVTTFESDLPTTNKMLSFFSSESEEGTANRRINTICGISGSGLDQGSSGGKRSNPWTLAFHSYMTMPGNETGDRPNGINWYIFQAQLDGTTTWSLYGQASEPRLRLEVRDNTYEFADPSATYLNELSVLNFDDCFGDPAENKMAHYVLVHDGTNDSLVSNTRLYIDGVAHTNTSSVDRRGNLGVGVDYSGVGFQGWNMFSFFNQFGQTSATSNTGCYRLRFDEMIMWTNRALTEAEVVELYNSGDTYNPQSHSRASDMTAMWMFDSGSIIDNAQEPPFFMYDSSENGNHITSSLRFTATGNEWSRLALSGSSLQTTTITGGYVTQSNEGHWNSNIAAYGDYNHSTKKLYVYTTAPFSGSVNYKIISRDHRDRGY